MRQSKVFTMLSLEMLMCLTKLYAMTRDQFHKGFCEQNKIHKSTIKSIMDCILNKHRVDDVPHVGWFVTVHIPERMEEIKEQILASPCLLVRKLTSYVHGSRSTVHYMLCGLHLYCYCILSHQELKLPDYKKPT